MSFVPVYSQSMQQEDREELQVCPFDPAHRISTKRFVRHIIKCKKNHPNSDLVQCPFNARHYVHKPELPMHISTCSDKRMIQNEIHHQRLMFDGDEAKGDTSVPPYTPKDDIHFGNDEDWDLEIQTEAERNNHDFVIPSTRYCFEADFEDRRLRETPIDQRPQQTFQPFPMERRPYSNPHLSSGVLGTGRGRILNTNSSGANPQPTRLPSGRAGASFSSVRPAVPPSVVRSAAPYSALRATGPSCPVRGATPSLAANFSIRAKQWTTVGRARPPSSNHNQNTGRVRHAAPSVNLPRRNFAEDEETTGDLDEELEKSLASINRMTREMRMEEEEYNAEEGAGDFSATLDGGVSSSSGNDDEKKCDALRKEKRKLMKSMKQIEKIETKLKENKPVNPDEMVKLNKKMEIKTRMKEIDYEMEDAD